MMNETELRWERPGDELMTWYLDDHQVPSAIGPLSQSLYAYMFQGFRKAQREMGRQVPGSLRLMFVRGYLYVQFQPGSPLSEQGKEAARRSPLTWDQVWLPEIQANLDRLNAYPLATLADDQLAAALQDGLKSLARHWEIHHSLSFNAANELDAWYRARFPAAPQGEAFQLLQGLGNASVEGNRALWALSQVEPAGFAPALAAFLDRYGRRPANYCDVGVPTWLENPAPVLSLLARYRAEGAPDPAGAQADRAAEREALLGRVRAQLADEERPAFVELLGLAQAAVRAREDHAFWIEGQSTAALRRSCVEFGRRMAAVGILTDPADVALVTAPELLRFGYGFAQPHLRAELPTRRAEHEANLAHRPAPWLGAPPEEEEPGEAPGASRMIQGRAVSPGLARGPARVVANLAEAQAIRYGEVLICKETDPGWTPVLLLAAAVVLDSPAGGMLGHAAIVAREFRLPVVSGTGSAMEQIQTGMLVEVDGAAGVVRIL